MSRTAIALALTLGLLGCRGKEEPVIPATPPDKAPPVEPVRPLPPTDPIEPVTEPASDSSTAAEDPCVTACVAERQMRATSIEAIRAGCRAECEAANGQGDGE